MLRPMVAGNWKMNGSIQGIHSLLGEIGAHVAPSEVNVVVFPPAVYLPLVQRLLEHTAIEWGAQNVYPADSGAFTGEISGPMLKEFGCRYVLVGHSERRHLLGDDEKIIAKKYHHVKEHDMIPVFCVGETLKEREQGLTEVVLARQMNSIMCVPNGFERAIIAYEPVWAIGTGKTATPEQAQEAHAFIRSVVRRVDAQHADALPILYGGSVNEKNAGELFNMPDVNGGLIGGASLDAQTFLEVIECIK